MKTFKQFLIEQTEAVALLPGGFKPPHKGHFDALKYLLDSGASKAIVYIGGKDRDGITPEMSKQIWDVYTKYIHVPVTVELVPNPVKAVYEFIDKNPAGAYMVGAGQEDMARYKFFEKNKEKYPNVKVVSIPPMFNRISGTQTRQKIANKEMDALSFTPDNISVDDKNRIKYILGI